jgi:hypothetical protein
MAPSTREKRRFCDEPLAGRAAEPIAKDPPGVQSVPSAAFCPWSVVDERKNDLRNVGMGRDGIGPKAVAASILLVDNLGGAPYVGENTIRNSACGIEDLSALLASPAPSRASASRTAETTGCSGMTWLH